MNKSIFIYFHSFVFVALPPLVCCWPLLCLAVWFADDWRFVMADRPVVRSVGRSVGRSVSSGSQSRPTRSFVIGPVRPFCSQWRLKLIDHLVISPALYECCSRMVEHYRNSDAAASVFVLISMRHIPRHVAARVGLALIRLKFYSGPSLLCVLFCVVAETLQERDAL